MNFNVRFLNGKDINSPPVNPEKIFSLTAEKILTAC